MSSALSDGSRLDIVERAGEAARGVSGVADATVAVHRYRATTRIGEPTAPPPRPGRNGLLVTEESSTATDRPPARLDAPPLVLPDDAPATLTDALVRAAKDAGDRGTTYVLADGSENRQTYRDLLTDAARMLSGLRENGLTPGESVLLHCDDNRNFVTGFWACLLGGFVATPIGVAPTYGWENATTRRLRGAWELLDRPPVLTDAALRPQVERVRSLWDRTDVRVLAAEELRATEPDARLHRSGPDDAAVHLLTSGSTGVPKCVRHTHQTIVRRAYANAYANGFGRDDVTLNFMPLDHVAGMVMHNLRDVILQCEHVNARTDSFIADPLRWLTWIERYRVTNTSAPNFVITLVTGLAGEIARRRWDLSSLRDITNGGEAIVSSTTHEFLRLLAPHGLALDVMRPAWGMSEMCGGVVHSTLRGDDEAAGVLTVDAQTMDGTLALLPGPTPGHPTFTEVGVPVCGTSVRVADVAGRTLPEDHIGHLQVRGATRMTGYHNNPEANRESFTDDGWFITGDLAFVHAGRLVMTGREKDLIIIRSANYPCHEIESVVDRVDGVLPTFVAACSEYDDETGSDELVVFCVLTGDGERARPAVLKEIEVRLSKEIGLRPRRIVFVAREAFPKTSAGKIERRRLLADHPANASAGNRAEAADPDRRSAGNQDDGQAKTPWLFSIAWLPADGRPGVAPPSTWVVFDHGGLAAGLRGRRDSAVGAVVSVIPGPGYERRSEREYRIDPRELADYTQLLTAVEDEHGAIGAVVHAWATDTYADRETAFSRGLDRSALSLHHLIGACGDRDLRLLVVTRGACPVSTADVVEPVHATVGPLVRTARAEGVPSRPMQLDLCPDEQDPTCAVMAELAEHGEDTVVARREGGRLVPRLRPLEGRPDDPAHRIRSGGLYLLTGGLAGIGHTIARSLLADHGVRLILSGCSAATEERATRLAHLAELGDVVHHRGDITDAQGLRDAVTAAEQRFGRPLDGVLHTAGAEIVEYWQDLESHLLRRERTAEFHRMYHAKVMGTHALTEVLRDRPDALLVLFSSVNGHFGGTAFGAYASANGFLPVFAEYWRSTGRPVQCHAWSFWSEDGQGGAAAERRGFRRITPDRGVELFRAALSEPALQVLIGLDDTNDDIAREIDSACLDRLDMTVTYRAAPSVPAGRVLQAVMSAVARDAVTSDRVRVRVEPMTDAVPATGGAEHEVSEEPVGEIERAVAEVWREVLAQPLVGREEHFFALGGHSLSAIRLTGRLNEIFQTQLSVHQLYEHPTVKELAEEIVRNSARMEGADSPV